MRFAMFYHSLLSDWNHGNAHFLRGVVRELLSRGHEVQVYEPRDGWSLQNLQRDNPDWREEFEKSFPELSSRFYDLDALSLERELEGVDVVLVHEWNDPQLVRRVGEHRRRVGGFRLLFHDTHHRCISAPDQMRSYDLSEYDGVLAFGRVVRDLYLDEGWARRAWTWHEAADARLCRPLRRKTEGDVIWIGNWGDGERSAEIRDYLIKPVRRLNLRACVHGVRYPKQGLAALKRAGIEYRGQVSNFHVPDAFARYRATVHIPRRPYRETLPGIPTIRVFEALACGIPLVCLHWDDVEELFTPGEDYLVAKTPKEMTDALQAVLSDEDLARQLAKQGRATVLQRHTCGHRVDELLDIIAQLAAEESPRRRQTGAAAARVKTKLSGTKTA